MLTYGDVISQTNIKNFIQLFIQKIELVNNYSWDTSKTDEDY